PAAGGGAGRARRCAGGAGRGRSGQDRAAGRCGGSGGWGADRPRRRGRVGDGAGLRRAAAAVRSDAGGLGAAAGSAAGGAVGGVRGAGGGEGPDGFWVGLAALSLLADAAQKQPLLCVIDDAQWLDRASAQALGVVARRLLAEPVALVVAAREPGGAFRGLPELAVGGLDERDARELLASGIARPLDEQVRGRFLAGTGGNPLALRE